MTKRLSLVLVLTLFAFTFAWKEMALAASAEANYKFYCAQCHGLKGKGDGPNASPKAIGINQPDMAVTPRNHASKEDMAKISDDQIKTAISDGGESVSKSALMPPWGKTLSPAEIDDLVKYLRKLCKCTYTGKGG